MACRGTCARVTTPDASTSAVTSSPFTSTFTVRPPAVDGVTVSMPSACAPCPGTSTVTGTGVAASGNHAAASA